MNIKNTITEHYRKFFDLHSKNIALDEDDHLTLDWAEEFIRTHSLTNRCNKDNDISFELPSDDIFDKPEVELNNPLEEFYYYERPEDSEHDKKVFRDRLQKALHYLKGKEVQQ